MLAGIMLLASWGCQRTINFSLPYEGDHLVVNAIFHPDRIMSVEVSQTAPALEDTIRLVDQASVWLYADGSLLDSLVYVGSGLYLSADSLRPQPDVSYQLAVVAPGFDSVFSEPVTMPAVPAFEPTHLDANWYRGNRNYHRLQMCQNDSAQASLFYRLVLYRDADLDRSLNTLSDLDTSSTPFTPGNGLFSDSAIDNDEGCFSLRVGDGSLANTTDTVYIHIQTVSEGYYRHLQSQRMRISGLETIFFRPDTLFTNINGGYGVFGIEQSRLYEVIAE